MKVAIVGGGMAGMIAAIAASKNKSDEIFIIEKNEKLGKKLFISGKGRCNLTNACDKTEFFKNVVTNSKFLFSAYSIFHNNSLMNLVEENGCKLKVERGNRVFPMSDKSYDVIDALKNAIKKNNIKVLLNTEVKKINKNEKFFKLDIVNENNHNSSYIVADRVIVTTGGFSYKSTGSTGDGYRFANDFGIDVVKVTPSLVPFNVVEVDECQYLQGLSLKNVAIKLFYENCSKKVLYSGFGEMLFTHFGLSGPLILSASSYVDIDCAKDSEDFQFGKVIDKHSLCKNESSLILSIDLKPALSTDKLNDRLLREISDGKNKNLKSIINTLLPHSLADIFVKRLGVDEIKSSEISKNLRLRIVELLKDFRFTIMSKRGFDEAIVTHGGVDVRELNPKTMESKRISGLYFAGEVIDVDALTGGFNIQIAATTGYVAGISSVS